MNYTESTFYPQAAINESNMVSGNVGTSASMGAPSVATEPTTAPAPTNSSSMPTNMADYGLDKFVSETSVKKTWDYPNGIPTFTKIWIDGTAQPGKLVNSNGKITTGLEQYTIGKLEEAVNKKESVFGNSVTELTNQLGYLRASLGSAATSSTAIMLQVKSDYPKDMGFVKGDGRGNYFYFEPLPAYKMEEIAGLIKLKKEKEEAEAKAKALAAIQADKKAREEAARKAAEAKEKYERAKAEAEAKRISQQQSESQRLEQEKNKKTKRNTILIIVGVLVVAVVVFFFLKKKK